MAVKFGMAPGVEIRRARPENAAAIASVLHESFVEFRSLYTEAGFTATVLDAERVLNRMHAGPVWIALHNGAVLGTIAALIKGSSVYIRGMAVLPSARGTGAGTALLREAEEWAGSQGCSHVFLSTTPFLSSAIHLYERFGFRRRADGSQDLFGTPLFVMEKTVSG
jgi:GNAT superfamily N-acetyltransferase